jgi:hypothetical protein
MKQESRDCQNCKKNFRIDSEDFNFYEKIKVPPPTFCPECRFQRRLMFRNERNLYKRDCELCGKNVVAIYASERGRKVYCQPCWWSDKWDGIDYGMEYDPRRNFFEQMKELSLRTPYPSLITDYSTLVNSEYVNHVGNTKNCYLVFNTDYAENVAYSVIVNYTKDSLDSSMYIESELGYEAINCTKCFRVFFSEDCTSSTDMYFSKDCVGSSHCFGCIGLRNKQYHWFNKPIGKEEFVRRLAEANLGSREAIIKTQMKARQHWEQYPHKYYHGTMNMGVSGDYVSESKNARNMYQARHVEDGRYCQMLTMAPIKDVYDLTEWGAGAELVYDGITVGGDSQNVQFCFASWSGAVNTQYCMLTPSCRNCFGCVNLKKGEYSILNKRYSKGDYEALRKKIIDDLERSPYIDSKGRAWKFGEFLPYDLSPFAYNESHAAQYFPLDKQGTKDRGWEWYEPAPSLHKATMSAEQIPDLIQDIDNSILKEVLECETCRGVFRLIPLELQLLKKFSFPIPARCSNCRHMDRLGRINPPRLWRRKCQCAGAKSENGVYTNTASSHQPHSQIEHCPNEFETAYAPQRKEIVYCESCYQAETV